MTAETAMRTTAPGMRGTAPNKKISNKVRPAILCRANIISKKRVLFLTNLVLCGKIYDKAVFSMGIATVITSGKGGVGKSTASVGLGRALAARGRRVLLVDCDAGLRGLDRLSGTEAELVYDISDVVFGRCSPAEAIYPCRIASESGGSAGPENEDDGSRGLFLLPAPARVEDMVRPPVMRRLIPLLKRYYDHVLLDSPAGVGMGFQAAACAADRALVLCGPDPVSVRSASSVRLLLTGLEIKEMRLIINQFDRSLFRETGAFADLDGVIDAAGIQLGALVPLDHSLAAAFLRGRPAPENSPGMLAMSRAAARLEGESVPMPAWYLS